MKKEIKYLVIIVAVVSNLSGCRKEEKVDLKTWYEQPAKTWFEALPVGNGKMGAMVFGNPENECIQINEESIWAGKPSNSNNPLSLEYLPKIREAIFDKNYKKALEYTQKGLLGTPPRIRSYQPFGNLLINYGWIGDVENYSRTLNLNNGVATVNYTVKGHNAVQRTYISALDNVMVVDFSLKGDSKTDITFQLQRDMDVDKLTYTNEGELLLKGQITDMPDTLTTEAGKHVSFTGMAKIISHDGQISTTDTALLLKNCSRYSLFLTVATDYVFEDMNFDKSIDTEKKCREILNRVSDKKESAVFGDHDKEHRAIFERVSMDIENEDRQNIPTDKRIAKVREGGTDPELDILMFQFGRYLLMNSSRAPGKLPANLQGVWNKDYQAAWNSDFHTNINLQMNYWGANNGNLNETCIPLIHFMSKLAEKSKPTAKEVYGCDGWVIHHLTNPFGHSSISDGPWGVTPLNGAWMTAPLFRYYTYTNDIERLRTDIYPVLKGACEFILDFMIEKDGMLVTNPSHSPENKYIDPVSQSKEDLTYSATCDTQIITETFNNFIKAAGILQVDDVLVKKVESAMNKIPKVKIGANGTIQEWIEDYDENEPGHRHMSHLLGLYPFTQITPDKKEMFEAASKTIERRLEYLRGYVGWSDAWITNMYARLYKPEKAYAHIQTIERKMLLNNLFISVFAIEGRPTPIFQIDANCGVISGVIEMLMQSHSGYIDLLPALPDPWKSGSIKGIVAQNGFEVSMSWRDKKLEKLQVKSLNGGLLKIKFRGKTVVETETEKGRTYNYRLN